ncbi:Hypothetical_protein [Hexamita inflata]|uniref:Hypothetical_protein n=1 Tax=Hexamita inflata TaxID=28002 RepID=A0AA86NZQ4_9EUKA|nr:Hypothetical protein HINF_LOCUS16195 [Hexamita inflata]
MNQQLYQIITKLHFLPVESYLQGQPYTDVQLLLSREFKIQMIFVVYERFGSAFDVRVEVALLEYQLSVVDDGFIRLRFSFLAASHFPGQLGCGRKNPPIQSAELPRIGMAKGMPSTSLQDWKAATAPLLPQKRRWYDAGGFPYKSSCTKPRYAPGCLYPSRCLPWLRRCAQRTQVYLKLMIIRVNLQFLYRRPNQYKRKLSEWDIYIMNSSHRFLFLHRLQLSLEPDEACGVSKEDETYGRLVCYSDDGMIKQQLDLLNSNTKRNKQIQIRYYFGRHQSQI